MFRPFQGRPRPRKHQSGFGRREPLVGLSPSTTYDVISCLSLKGIVPEVAAHVSVLLGVACGGGNVAQPHASTAAFTAGMRCVQAAGWYVELTQRGFLQELGSDCGHMAARNAPKQLQCMQCELYKSRGGYKTKQGRSSGLVIVCAKCVRTSLRLRQSRTSRTQPRRRPQR